MKEQIVKLMEAEGLTPAKFADEIGVQRSSISHIVSGRNKPSYDFILKILKRFSGLNTEWLLTGKGSMIKSSETDEKDLKQVEKLFNRENDLFNKTETGIRSYNTGSKLENGNLKTKQEDNQKKNQDLLQNQQFTNVNNINYILVFYRDGTFKQYNARE